MRTKAKTFCDQQGDSCAAGLTPTLQAPDLYLASVLNPLQGGKAPIPAPAPIPVQKVAVEAVNTQLLKIARPVNDQSEVANVASISAQDATCPVASSLCSS